MTDKELFEKTEKVFNLDQENKLIEKVYEKSKFKKILERNSSSTSPIRSNDGNDTVNSTRAVGRGVGATAGAAAKGLGKFGKFLRGVIPGTNTNRRKTAETRKQEAQSKAERLKNVQMQQKLMGFDNEKADKKPAINTPTKPEVNFKVGDTVLVKTKKNPNAEGKVTALFPDNPGHEIQVKIGKNAPYAFDERNISLRRGINKESFQYICKKYK